MTTGIVKWFSAQKGYGFISPEDSAGDDVFVHISAIEKSGLDELQQGDRVSFDLELGRNKKMQAANIKLAE